MYVCVCNGITEEQLKSVASKGYQGHEALAKLGVGDNCGVCVLDALEKYSKKFPALSTKNPKKTKKFSPS